jgi:hypothetical protein
MSSVSSTFHFGNLIDHALAYAASGWSVLAVDGKRAVGKWRAFQKHAPDDGTLHRLFTRTGITGLAAVTGAVSAGLAVRHFDRVDAYDVWAEAHPTDANSLPTVRTVRGFHVYGRLDVEDYRTLADGELRADSRHYVLLPPSLHPDGIKYDWIGSSRSAGSWPSNGDPGRSLWAVRLQASISASAPSTRARC